MSPGFALLAVCGLTVTVVASVGLRAVPEDPTGADDNTAPTDGDTSTTAALELVATSIADLDTVGPSEPTGQYEIAAQPDIEADYVISAPPELLTDLLVAELPADAVPAGLVVFEADEPMDPVRIEIESAGSIRERDIFVAADYPAAVLLADALVSPAYVVVFPDALEQFILTANVTVPYRIDFVNDTDPADLRIAVFDPATEIWQVAPGKQVHNAERREITIDVSGFTSYAVIRFPTTQRLHEHQEANIGRWD